MSTLRSGVACVCLLSVILSCQVSRGELVGHWPLRESHGDVFVDLAAENDGFLPSGSVVQYADDGPPGVSDSSIMFIGDEGPSFIETPFAGVGGFDARTIAAWVKAEPNARATAVVGWGSLDNGRKWHFRIETAGDVTRIRTEFNGGQNYGGDTDIGDGQWHHIVSVFPDGGFEGDDIIHYVDGVEEPKLGGTSLDIDTAILAEEGAFPVNIGFAVGHAGRWFQGQIADVRIYDEALDQAAIQELMNTPSMLPPGEPGDFNSDGLVNLEDFTVLASNFNSNFSLRESYAKGDFDLNARVDMRDFLGYRAVLNSGQQGLAASVPEPNSMGWVLLVGMAGCRKMRRRVAR